MEKYFVELAPLCDFCQIFNPYMERHFIVTTEKLGDDSLSF